MINDSLYRQEGKEPESWDVENALMRLREYCQSVEQPRKRAGRPALLSWQHLCLAIVTCFLQGWCHQRQVWRLIRGQRLGPFEPLPISDQAIYNRLAGAATPMRWFFEQVSRWLAEGRAGWQERTLAPFAWEVLALDESTLDQVGRWLPDLRRLGHSAPGL